LFVRSTKFCVADPVPPLPIGSTPVNVRFGVRPPLDAMLPLAVTEVTGDVTNAPLGIVEAVMLAPDITGGDEKVFTPATV
jgi:hypothetical protein